MVWREAWLLPALRIGVLFSGTLLPSRVLVSVSYVGPETSESPVTVSAVFPAPLPRSLESFGVLVKRLRQELSVPP